MDGCNNIFFWKRKLNHTYYYYKGYCNGYSILENVCVCNHYNWKPTITTTTITWYFDWISLLQINISLLYSNIELQKEKYWSIKMNGLDHSHIEKNELLFYKQLLSYWFKLKTMKCSNGKKLNFIRFFLRN